MSMLATTQVQEAAAPQPVSLVHDAPSVQPADFLYDAPSMSPVCVRRVEAMEPQEIADRLAGRLRIAVVHGGKATDDGAVIHRTSNPRSAKTYEAVANDIASALKNLGFEHVELFPEDMRLGERLRKADIDFAWLNSGGTQGYSPVCHAASMLEMFGVPYLGHNPLNSALLDNKHAFKYVAAGNQIPTAPFMVWHGERGRLAPRANSMFRKIFADYAGPFVVKPVSGRASINVEIADDLDVLPEVVHEIYQKSANFIIIEKFLGGSEYCVAVCGSTIAQNRWLSRRNAAFCFSFVERTLGSNERIFTSMDVRPITTDRVRLLDAENEADLVTRLATLGQAVHREFGLESIVRLDVRADENGDLFVLEANPKPDLKRPANGQLSIVAAGLESEGMDYEDLILSLVADRLSFLVQRRAQLVPHIVEKLTA